MTRLSKLKQKEVVNCVDGKRLGYICDLVIDEIDGRICALVVPAPTKFIFFSKNEKDYVIPYKNIRKIGKDVILVELDINCMPHYAE